MNKPNWSGELLRVPDAAMRLGLKPSTVRRMVMEKKIDIVRPTKRSVRIPSSVVDDILVRGYRPAVTAR